jgi:hypothetical protein
MIGLSLIVRSAVLYHHGAVRILASTHPHRLHLDDRRQCSLVFAREQLQAFLFQIKNVLASERVAFCIFITVGVEVH